VLAPLLVTLEKSVASLDVMMAVSLFVTSAGAMTITTVATDGAQLFPLQAVPA
jgi:hypothetical protein